MNDGSDNHTTALKDNFIKWTAPKFLAVATDNEIEVVASLMYQTIQHYQERDRARRRERELGDAIDKLRASYAEKIP